MRGARCRRRVKADPRSYKLHSLVMVSSRFKMARLTIAQAATLCRLISGGILVRSGEATLTAAAVSFSKWSYCSFQNASSLSVSERVGVRPVQSRNAYRARALLSGLASFNTRTAIACATSTNVFSLSVVRACKGVLERALRGQEVSPEGASKAESDGNGNERFQKV